MPSLASVYRSWTAWASTCAAEWRSTARPSWLDMATGSTSVPAAGAQLRSRSTPSGPRTTTTASGPVPGSPAAATACAHVVPAATAMRRSAARAGRGGDTAVLLRNRRRSGLLNAGAGSLDGSWPAAGQSSGFLGLRCSAAVHSRREACFSGEVRNRRTGGVNGAVRGDLPRGTRSTRVPLPVRRLGPVPGRRPDGQDRPVLPGVRLHQIHRAGRGRVRDLLRALGHRRPVAVLAGRPAAPAGGHGVLRRD